MPVCVELQLVRGEQIGVGSAVEEDALLLLQIEKARGRATQLAQPVVNVEEPGSQFNGKFCLHSGLTNHQFLLLHLLGQC